MSLNTEQTTYIFATRKIGGGVGTLFYRLVKYCKKRGDNAIIVAEIMKSEFERDPSSADDYILITERNKYYRTIKELCLSLHDQNQIRIITTNIVDYIEMADLLLKLPNTYIIIYSVHAETFRVWHRISYFYKRNILQKSLENDGILFMDEENIDAFIKSYDLEISDYKKVLQRLPIESVPVDITLHNNADKIEILSIARADFPYKGYLLGLVRKFAQIADYYPKIYLKIVSYGTGFNALVSEIDKQPTNIKERITLFGQKSYEELQTIYEHASIYIGMGTTILEAANYGLPAVVVKAMTTELVEIGLFSDNPKIIGLSKKEIVEKPVLESLLTLDKKTYEEKCNASKKALEDTYGIESAIERFSSYGVHGMKLLSRTESIILHIYSFLLSLRGKLKTMT